MSFAIQSFPPFNGSPPAKQKLFYTPDKFAALPLELQYLVLVPSVIFGIMHMNNCVLAGSAVLHVAETWSFTPPNLDIFVSCHNVHDVIRLISAAFPYELEATLDTFPETHGITAIYTMKSTTRSIHVIATNRDNPIHAITQSPNTLLMNCITCMGIYCPYPRLIVRSRGLINITTEDYDPPFELATNGILKYLDRGFSLADNSSDWPANSDLPTPTMRFLSDQHGLWFPLRTNSLTPSQLMFGGGLSKVVWRLS